MYDFYEARCNSNPLLLVKEKNKTFKINYLLPFNKNKVLTSSDTFFS